MKQLLSASIAALTLLATAPAVAQQERVLVELFTSQGCSSCPPADAYLGDLAARDDVLALSLHVDYWDYLGWADRFAHPEMTARQRAYSSAHLQRSVYTPQMIIDGRAMAVGHDRTAVSSLIGEAALRPLAATIALERVEGSLRITIDPAFDGQSGVVHLVRFMPEAKQRIERGENAGTDITYHNVVTGWDVIARWNGGNRLIDAPLLDGAEGIAVILQDGPVGGVISAAVLEE